MGKNQNLEIAEAYYKAVGEKNLETAEKLLHPDVQFSGPLAKMDGKEAVLEGTKRFTTMYHTLSIRSKCSSDEQAVIVYDLDCPQPLGRISSASLMTFKDGLVSGIELFYDARPFEMKKG